MDDLVVRVKSPVMAACMTCPLCHELLDDATTIPLCLHTFCRKCIHDMLSVKDVDSCPICNSDLGCSPINKLRPDHALRSLRDKIFPQKNKETKISGTMPPVTLPTIRKERSLSSPVTLPRVTGRSVSSCHTPASPFEEHSPKSDDPSKDCLTETKPAESPKKSGEAKDEAICSERVESTPPILHQASEPASTSCDFKMLLTMLNSLFEVETWTKENFTNFESIKDSLEESPSPPFSLRNLINLLNSQFWSNWDEYKAAAEANNKLIHFCQKLNTPSVHSGELIIQQAQIVMLEERDRDLVTQLKQLQAERMAIGGELNRLCAQAAVSKTRIDDDRQKTQEEQRALSSLQTLVNNFAVKKVVKKMIVDLAKQILTEL